MIDQLITFLILVLVAGVLWWVFTTLVPLPAPFNKVAYVVIVLILLLMFIGIFFGGYHLPLLRSR
jgi:hypothetical protein